MTAGAGGPTFSVVIPLYDKAAYIARTLAGVLAQTWADLEVVVVDDGSTDAGPDIVAAIDDPRVRLVRQANAGVSAARNRGIEEARGTWIAFLDADDEWLPEKLERHHALHAAHPDARWSCSAFVERVPEGGRLRRAGDRLVRYADTGVLDDALEAMGDGLNVHTVTVVAHRDCLVPACRFPVGLSRGEDKEVWVKLACAHPRVGYVGEAVAVYHVAVDSGLTRTAAKEADLRFLEMWGRIRAFGADLAPARRAALDRYLRTFLRARILQYWSELQAPAALLRHPTVTELFSRRGRAALRVASGWPAPARKAVVVTSTALGLA
ncbi:MAG: glycosyltransferase family 2 protein [Alphaproteobacteria bacterium]|nr:glycosyltransferase family 2 protein [Alphaproteobacteria bacterium]MCB9697325.1 glycosyltransferase family 2 protein [Alphaproteobacteria bacterium]